MPYQQGLWDRLVVLSVAGVVVFLLQGMALLWITECLRATMTTVLQLDSV